MLNNITDFAFKGSNKKYFSANTTFSFFPMGIHPNDFWGNLYPSKYECDFMSKLNKKDIIRAK